MIWTFDCRLVSIELNERLPSQERRGFRNGVYGAAEIGRTEAAA